MPNVNEEIRRRNKDAAQHAALFWIQLANERQSEIIRQLLGLSAVLLPLSASIVISNEILSPIDKYLLASSWVFFLVSMVAGFIQIQEDSKYFLMLSRDSSKREELWSDSNHSVPNIERDVLALGKVPAQSTTLPQNIQAVTFFVGLILVMLTGSFILFKNAHPNNQPSQFNRRIYMPLLKQPKHEINRSQF